LRESEERYLLALKGSNDGIWDWNVVTGETFFSDRWKAILGYRPEEIAGDVEEWKKRIHLEDFDRVMEAHRENFKGNVPVFEVEYRLRHKDGSYRWIYGRGTCLKDERGVVVRAAGSHTDITARKMTEATLRSSEERLSALLCALPDLIFRIDRGGTFLDFQTPSRGLLAVPPDQILGRRLSDIMPGEIVRESLRRIDETLRAGDTSLPLEYRLPIEGRVLEFEARFARCTTDEVIAVVRDIPEKKRAEETIRKSKEHLLQVRKREEIGRLAGGLAHHLNNLMTVVTGYSELLLTQVPEDDPRFGAIVKIRAAGERAAELTRALLAFSRQQILRPRVVDLNRFLSDRSTMLRDLAGRSVRFTLSEGEDAGSIRVDTEPLHQALVHLVSNSRDAMPGGGELILSTAASDLQGTVEGIDVAPGRYVLLAVRDSGSGIDDETRARIFEPFFSLKTGSEGMGLPSIYGFVKQSGGYIFVDSSPGRGTTFRIYFPRVAGTEVPDPPAGSPFPGIPDAG